MVRHGPNGPVGPEKKFVPPFPPESPHQHLYYYRRQRDDGRALPYFYDIEVDGDSFTVQTWHGKPGKYMWRNFKQVFASSEVSDPPCKC